MHSIVSHFDQHFCTLPNHSILSPIAYFQQLPARLSRKSTRAISLPARSSMMASSPPLPRRNLGQTGLEVSVLGFGAAPLGGVFQVNQNSLFNNKFSEFLLSH